MKRYVFCKEYDDMAKKRILKNFYNIFGIRLDAVKYQNCNGFEDCWETLVTDVFANRKSPDLESHVGRFVGLVNALANGGWVDGIVRANEDKLKRCHDIADEISQTICDMRNSAGDYNILEPDIYMNAYLSIKFLKTVDPGVDGRKGISTLDDSGIIEAKGKTYKVPFKDLHVKKSFCLEYQKCLLGQDGVQIFGTDLKEGENEKEIDIRDDSDFCGYKKRIEISFAKDKKCERWSRTRILEWEQKLKMEDRVLFYNKTIDSILPRNMVDLMIMGNKKFKAYDFIYLIDWLCTCDSIRWRNIIGLVMVFGRINQNVLETYGLWYKLEMCIDIWIEEIGTINRMLKCLSNVLVYMFYNINEGEEYIEARCKEWINEMEGLPCIFDGIFSETAKQRRDTTWAHPPKTMEIRAKNPLTDYCWTYVILQWRVIDNTTSDRCKKLANSKYNIGHLVYRVSRWYCLFKRVFEKQGTEKKTLENSAIRPVAMYGKGSKTGIIVESLGGNWGLMEICHDVIASFLQEANIIGTEADTVKMPENEAEIRRLFCREVRARSGHDWNPEGEEMRKTVEYMYKLLCLMDDFVRYQQREP